MSEADSDNEQSKEKGPPPAKRPKSSRKPSSNPLPLPANYDADQESGDAELERTGYSSNSDWETYFSTTESENCAAEPRKVFNLPPDKNTPSCKPSSSNN